MARPGTAASRPANLNKDSARPDADGFLSRELKLELRMRRCPILPLEDYVLPQTSDVVLALRKLAPY